MRKLLVILALIVAPLAVQAQTDSKSTSSDKSWNVTFNPLAFLVGVINADLDFALNDNWTVGPQFATFNFKLGDVKAEGSAFGGHARYYFSGVFNDGFYGYGALGTASFKLEDETNGDNAKASGTTLELGGGYHWFWETFNLRLGLSLAGAGVGEVEIKDAGGNVTDTVTPRVNTGLDFAIGFAF